MMVTCLPLIVGSAAVFSCDSALGLQQTPPKSIDYGPGLDLTFFIMEPVLRRNVWGQGVQPYMTVFSSTRRMAFDSRFIEPFARS